MSTTVAEIMRRIPGAIIPEKARDVDVVVHFKFTGDEAGEWNAVIRDGACTIAQGLPKSRPAISLAADSSDFIRVVTGEVGADQAVMDGRLKIDGDRKLAPRLLELFQVR